MTEVVDIYGEIADAVIGCAIGLDPKSSLG